MSFFVMLSLSVCLLTPMEPSVNEKMTLQLIQEWKTWHKSGLHDLQLHDSEKTIELGILAKKDKGVMKLLLKELETRDAPNIFYVKYLALLLGRIEALEAIPALSRILQDKTRHDCDRGGALHALGWMGKPALPALAEALKSSDVFGRKYAAAALTIMGDFGGGKQVPEAISLLLEAMKDEDEEVRNAAVGCFGFEVAFTPEFAGPYLLKALQHKNPFVRAGTAEASIRLKVNAAEAEKTLIELLGHPNIEVRLQALGGLGHEECSYGKAAVPPLRVALKDKDSRVRAGAALALSCQGPAAEPALGDLLKLLKEDKDEGVRAEAATALGCIGPAAKEAVPALIDALKNDSLIHWRAINALGDIGPNARAAIPLLEGLLREYQEVGSPDDVRHVALMLAKIRGK